MEVAISFTLHSWFYKLILVLDLWSVHYAFTQVVKSTLKSVPLKTTYIFQLVKILSSIWNVRQHIGWSMPHCPLWKLWLDVGHHKALRLKVAARSPLVCKPIVLRVIFGCILIVWMEVHVGRASVEYWRVPACLTGQIPQKHSDLLVGGEKAGRHASARQIQHGKLDQARYYVWSQDEKLKNSIAIVIYQKNKVYSKWIGKLYFQNVNTWMSCVSIIR